MMNKRMKDILNSASDQVILSEETPLFSNQIDIVWPEFSVVDDCYILIKGDNEGIVGNNIDIQSNLQRFGDRTGYEAYINHIHLSDYTEDNPLLELRLGFNLLNIWASKLKRDFPNEKFHIILAFNGQEATIRFHKYREDDGSWLNIDNLDGYEESIIVRTV